MKQAGVALVTSILLLGYGSVTLAPPPETGETGLVTIPTSDVLGPAHVSVAVSENGEIDNSQAVGEIELHRTEFSLALGVLSNLELSAQIPYVQFERNVLGNRFIAGLTYSAPTGG